MVLGLTFSMLFQQFENPSRVSNRPELDKNIPILLENPNRDSISVGTQEQLSLAEKHVFLNYHRICLIYLGYSGEFRVGVMMEITVHFLVLRKKTSIGFCKH